ncbi:MFS transporter [Stigmatella aurantiaca]|uniref:MFS transporter n=2 Tax=Stigmatella aurantiaca TaxID=41 RepID=UPI0002EFE3CF|nr:MFS transporter [Stigmatella aurantiaca]
MKAFLTVWLGQLISKFGSQLAGFALSIWVFESTGSTSAFALVSLAAVLPGFLVAPVAGLVADRFAHRWVMFWSDVVGLLCALGAMGLFLMQQADLWTLVVLVVLNSAADTFRTPAWMAATTLMVPKENIGRASGMVQASQALTQLVAPLAAGLLMSVLSMQGVLLIDFASFFIALATLLFVRFAKHVPQKGPAGATWQSELLEGWTYIRSRAGLLGLMVFSFTLNLTAGMAQVALSPLVLSTSTAAVLGSVRSIGGVGMVVGSILMGGWGGPTRKVYGVFAFTALFGISLAGFGVIPVGMLTSIACFGTFLCVPVILGCKQVILQRKVVPEVQGRVFALDGMVGRAASVISFVLAGPLVDKLLEPLMSPGGELAGSLGHVFGVGPGRGIALMFVGLGGLIVLLAVVGWLMPSLRRVEEDLPDVIPEPSAGLGAVPHVGG